MNGRKGKPPRFLGSRLGVIILTIALKMTYDLSYAYLVSPFFSWTPAYYPFSPNSIALLESYFLAIVLGLMIPRQLRQPSDLLLAFLGSVVILPMLTLHGLAGQDQYRAYTYMTILVYVLILSAVSVFPRVKFPVLRFGVALAKLLSIVTSIIIVIILASAIGLQAINPILFLDYGKMVEIRESVVEVALREHTILAYFYFWLFIVFLPTLIAVVLDKRKYVTFSLLVTGVILLTGITARRHTLAVVPVLLGTYLISRKPRLAPSLMILGFTIIVGAITIVSLEVPDLRIVGTWIERFFFVPPRLDYAYYDFFSRSGFVYLTSTGLPIPLEYPFEMIPERLVGLYVLQNPLTVASAGFLATSFMHAGFSGMMIFGLVVALLLKLCDSLVVHRIPLASGTALAMVVFSGLFRGADLTQWLLTFGGVLCFIMLFLLGRYDRRYEQRRKVYGRGKEVHA